MDNLLISESDPCGNIDAYADKNYLSNCFIVTQFHKELLDVNRCFLAGKRGSGKSATTLMLNDKRLVLSDPELTKNSKFIKI